MSLYGTGELTQGEVNLAIDQHKVQHPDQVLENVIVSGSITSLGPNAIRNTGFVSIVFPSDSLVTTFDINTFLECKSLTSLVLPPKLKELSENMCTSCSKLQSLIIPDSVTSFQGGTFYLCFLLESIEFGPGSRLTSVGPSTFYDCKAFTTVEFPESLTTIGVQTFTNANNVKTLRMHTSIWSAVNATLPVSGTQVVSFYNDPVFYTVSTSKALLPGTGMTLQDGVLSGYYDGSLSIVGTGTLSRAVIDTYVTNSGPRRGLVVAVDKAFTSLDDGIFSGLSGLTEIRFPEDSAVTTIGTRSFQGCTSLKGVDFPESLTSLGTAIFENCTSLQRVVFPQKLLSVSDTAILAGLTTVETLKMHENLWETAIRPSLVENKNVDTPQLVQFYGETEILQTLETQLDYWTGLEGLQSTNAEGYQDIVDYYSGRGATYNVDYSDGETKGTLVNYEALGLIYDVRTNSLSGLGTYDGALTIVGGSGELTQSMVDAALVAHNSAQQGLVPLHTLTVGPEFTSLSTTLSLQGTGITDLLFPAENLITTMGAFELAIDSTLDTVVVLPKWVVQQSPWSL
jgi:hypothetical protein